MSPSEGPTAILIVDDEESILSALTKFLTVKGYDVSTAASRHFPCCSSSPPRCSR